MAVRLSWKKKEGVSKCAPSFFMHKARTFPVWALLLSKVYVSLDISFLRYGKIYFRLY